MAPLTAGAAVNGGNRLNFTHREPTFGLGFPKRSSTFVSNIKEVTDLALLTAGAAENGGNRLDFTHRKPTFGLGFPKQSSQFSSSNIKKVTDLATLMAGAAKNGGNCLAESLCLVWDCQWSSTFF